MVQFDLIINIFTKMSGRTKEQGKLSEGRKERLRKLLFWCEHYLDDFIDEVPEEIISRGKKLVGSTWIPVETGVDGTSVEYKCQKSWLNAPMGIAGSMKLLFPSDKRLVAQCEAYEDFMVAQNKIPPVVDALGRPHRLVTRKQIDASNEIFKIAIKKLKSELGK